MDHNPRTSARAVGVLEQAANIISGPREEEYGEFVDNMTRVANTFNGVKGTKTLEPRDVALFLMCLKLCRLDEGWGFDSGLDITGYAALTTAAFTDETAK